MGFGIMEQDHKTQDDDEQARGNADKRDGEQLVASVRDLPWHNTRLRPQVRRRGKGVQANGTSQFSIWTGMARAIYP